MRFEIGTPLKHKQIWQNLQKKLQGKRLQSPRNSIILTTGAIGFLMNLKSPKFMNFITLIDSLFHTGSKPHWHAYH